MLCKKIYRSALLLLFIAFFFLFSRNLPDIAHASESSCVSCHTSAGKLIKITREIAASRPEVEKSEETAGEG